MAEPKVWFITGALTGFGRHLTEHLLKNKYRVVATLLEPEALSELVSQFPSTQLVVVKVDVTQHGEISAAFTRAKETFGRIDVVFNNAGKMINGELESINDEHAREMFEVNFWGAAQVSREAVRFFREVNQPCGGRLLQMSSALGIVSRAISGHYSASKAALEALTEALADELDPDWNIKITTLEPGPFRTEIFTVHRHVAPVHPAYTDAKLPGSRWRTILQSSEKLMNGDPKKACIAFEKVSLLENPPMRLPLHQMALDMANEKGKSLMEVAAKYKGWSDDVCL